MVGRVAADASFPSRADFIVESSPFETLKRAESGRSPAGSRAARTWNWSSLHMGGTDTRGYLGARVALNVLGLRRCGVGGRRGQRPAEGFRSAMAGVAFRDFSRGDHSSRSRMVRSTRRSGRHVPVEGGGEALLQELHLGTPLFHSLRGLRGLGLRILCGWNARDRDGRRGRQFSACARVGERRGRGRRSSRVARDVGTTRRCWRPPRTLSHVCCRYTVNGSRALNRGRARWRFSAYVRGLGPRSPKVGILVSKER